jgi:long-chain acyl-CoA synthetase
MSMRLIQRFLEHSQTRPNEAALFHAQSGGSWTWSQLDRASAAVADHLSRHLPARAVVVLCSPNEPAFVTAFLGIVRAGMKAFPLSPLLPARELIEFSEASAACAIIGEEQSIQAAGRNRLIIKLNTIFQMPTTDSIAHQHNADSAALLLTSSGTTRRPKIVHRSSSAVEAVGAAICQAVGFAVNDHVLSVVPLCHAYGLEHGLLAPIRAGSCMHLCEGFDIPTVLEQFRAGITIFPGVPFMFETLARTGESDVATLLRRAYSAGGPLPLPVAQAFAKRYGIAVGQIYGTTETGSVTFSDPGASWFNPLSVGRPMQNVHLRANPETAEIAIYAPSMLDGYAGDQDADSSLSADGHFLTGDVGQIDDHGNLILDGRLKLLIDVGGLKVNPLEVESVLASHPLVEACVVVPMRLSDTVTRLKALVISRSRQSMPAAAELRQFVKQRLAPHKVPRVFEFRDQLPRSPTGKILRHLIEG